VGAGVISRIEPVLNLTAVFIPGTIFLAWDVSRAVYILLSLAAFVYLAIRRPSLPPIHRFYTWPILGFVGAAALSVWYHGWSAGDANALVSRYFLLLLAIPLAALFYVSYNPERTACIKFVPGSVIMGVLALLNVLVLNISRANGGGNAVVFGFIALVMTIPIIASYHQLRNLRFGKYYFLGGIFMGFCAMFLSGTRSSWIVAILLIVIATVYYLDFFTLPKRILIACALIFCFVAAGLSIPSVEQRTEHMTRIIMPYVEGEPQSEFNSLRYRVEAWKASWHIGMTEPVFGIGLGDFKKYLRAYVEENPQLATLDLLRHAHNQFMHSFAISGFAGLISFVALLACHLCIFASFLRKCYNTEVRSLALAGFMLVVAYMIFSIPEVPFNGKPFLMMYAFSSASIWGCLLGAQCVAKQESESPRLAVDTGSSE
jgi:O-antigen ligase